jgi:hypothetical protein
MMIDVPKLNFAFLQRLVMMLFPFERFTELTQIFAHNFCAQSHEEFLPIYF